MAKYRFQRKRMYAVSKDHVGIISGTMAYSRGDAIDNFLRGELVPWHVWRRGGYRTVKCGIRVIDNRRNTTV